MKKESAFSGLEAAIVLIAFVVVAAVFSYVMLGAGFFATQKSQEVTYSGIKQSTSNLVLEGQLYGNSAALSQVEFSITIPEGGQVQNLNEIDFVITSSKAASPKSPTSKAFKKDDDSDWGSNLLKPGEKVLVRLGLPDPLAGGDSFTIEMKPINGAATLISKTLSTGYPGGIII